MNDPVPANPNANTAAIAKAVDEAQFAGKDDPKLAEKEQNEVSKCFKEYDEARKFDKQTRGQYAIDRRYAAGTSDPTWAVTTNLIGSFIDILVSFLYARNPDVSCSKAEQVDNRNTKQQDDFAKTMELVISRLWKKSKLKLTVRKQVRSTLSVGVGWFKAVLMCDAPKNPQMQNDLKDIRDKIAELTATKDAVEAATGAYGAASPEEIDANLEKQRELEEAIKTRMEVAIKKYLAIDFIAAQNMQTSIDIENTEDYLDADWNANAIYVLKSELKTRFPRLTEEDVKIAKCYYQKQTKELQPLTDVVTLMPDHGGPLDSDAAEQYVTGTSTLGNSGTEQGPEFGKVIELWDRRTGHIKTIVEGVKRWAIEPYEPPYASSRFYPYFRLSFYEVDGARHPQSLSWRLHKLQDEYARSRSNFRLTRERSIPGTLFNASNVTPEDAQKVQQGVHQEMIGIKPVDPQTPIQNLFAAKPTAAVDGRLFDNQPILADMEKIGGVQEALQSSVTTPKTATEAGIQQSGFASRTTSDRDSLEDLLTELAEYTSELALGALKIPDVQRIAGVAAFWPENMDIEDLLTMVEVEIKAGSTGKPKQDQDKQAWGVILPVLKEALAEISGLITKGDLETARCVSELVRETMRIMGDSTDPELFIPQIPDSVPPPPPPPPPPPKVSISLKGELPPGAAGPIAAEALPPAAIANIASTPGSSVPAPAQGGGHSNLPPMSNVHEKAGAGTPELKNPNLQPPTI